MANMERQFRDGFAAQTPDSEGPSDQQGSADEQDPGGGDMQCPCCGASALKIVQAVQGGGGQPPPQ